MHTTASITSAYDDERWLGFGYLGERRHAVDADTDVSLGDAALLDHANAKGWSADDLFEWMNSKLGRWFGEEAFFGTELRRSEIATSKLLTLDFG